MKKANPNGMATNNLTEVVVQVLGASLSGCLLFIHNVHQGLSFVVFSLEKYLPLFLKQKKKRFFLRLDWRLFGKWSHVIYHLLFKTNMIIRFFLESKCMFSDMKPNLNW